MDPQIRYTDPTHSPSSSNVLRFWEDPILDYAQINNQPVQSVSHDGLPFARPHPLPSLFQDTHEPSGRLDPSNDWSFWDSGEKFDPAEYGTNTNVEFMDTHNRSIPVGSNNPRTSNAEHVTNSTLLNCAPHDQFNCGHCQVLREVIHSNGIDMTKLEIHGTVGMLYHAITEVVQYGINGVEVNVERQLIDFSMATYERVKQYLTRYGHVRAREGYTLVKDSICAFYDALCTGMSGGDAACDSASFLLPLHQPGFGIGMDDQFPAMDWDAFSNLGPFFEPTDQMGSEPFIPPDHAPPPLLVLEGRDAASGLSDALLQATEQSGGFYPVRSAGATRHGKGQLRSENGERCSVRLSKSGIAEQRERTSKLKLKDLVGHFHLPIQMASRRLSVCSTVLKKICRRNGLKRWPYRKVKSLERRIRELQKTCSDNDGRGDDEGVRAEIEQLQQERARLCAGIIGKG